MTSPAEPEPREPEEIPEPPAPPAPETDSPDAAEHNALHGVTISPTGRTMRNLDRRVIE